MIALGPINDSAHESAADLLVAFDYVDKAEIALEAARRSGRWATYREGTASARAALKFIGRNLHQQKEKLEALIHAAATTAKGEPLADYTPPRPRGRATRKGASC
jgi:hypothetical protein